MSCKSDMRATLGTAWRRLFSRGEDQRQEALSALTALRAAAEALRDHPDASGDQRKRLVNIVLAEETRLERLLARAA